MPVSSWGWNAAPASDTSHHLSPPTVPGFTEPPSSADDHLAAPGARCSELLSPNPVGLLTRLNVGCPWDLRDSHQWPESVCAWRRGNQIPFSSIPWVDRSEAFLHGSTGGAVGRKPQLPTVATNQTARPWVGSPPSLFPTTQFPTLVLQDHFSQ